MRNKKQFKNKLLQRELETKSFIGRTRTAVKINTYTDDQGIERKCIIFSCKIQDIEKNETFTLEMIEEPKMDQVWEIHYDKLLRKYTIMNLGTHEVKCLKSNTEVFMGYRSTHESWTISIF